MRELSGISEARDWLAGRLVSAGQESDRALVTDIINEVRRAGDEALLGYARRFDAAVPDSLLVSERHLVEAHAALDPELLAAIRLAVSRIRAYYSRQGAGTFEFEDERGQLGLLVRPLDSVGCYVPGGQVPLFSTLLMTATVAQVAQVPRVVVASPPGADGLPHTLVLAAAHELGITEVYATGGAQAIAALAYGTETVRPVSKIVGPGNRFVTEAKRQVFGHVGIESLAGPTETLVLADSSADPAHVVADLLAQAEHDMAVPVLVTDSAALRSAVLAGLEPALADLPTAAVARDSLTSRGAAILLPDLQAALEFANDFAPEHLCLLVSEPEKLLPGVRNAGGVFLGHGTMEALGDYVAGPSHVMPTGGSARFASFVNLRDFQKVIPVVRASSPLLEKVGPAGALLARSEGLEAHARAIEARLD